MHTSSWCHCQASQGLVQDRRTEEESRRQSELSLIGTIERYYRTETRLNTSSVGSLVELEAPYMLLVHVDVLIVPLVSQFWRGCLRPHIPAVVTILR